MSHWSWPPRVNTQVWALPLSLATTYGIIIIFSSSPYLDVSVQEVWHLRTSLQLARFPHSDICGSKFDCNSPQLFAAFHVLRILREPRHSPYALIRFHILLNRYVSFHYFAATKTNKFLLNAYDLCIIKTFSRRDSYGITPFLISFLSKEFQTQHK